LVILPLIIFGIFLHKKYQISFLHIFFPFFFNKSFKEKNIHFHCASFGETKSIEGIIQHLNNDINITVMTNTGFNEAKKYTKNVRYIPFDIFNIFWLKPQKALFVIDSELWFMLFYIYQLKKTPVYIINARISKESLRKKMKLSFLYKYILANIDIIYTQNKKDIKRFKKLGAKNVIYSGNIKTLCPIKTNENLSKIKKNLIVAGSTHQDEERIILDKIDYNTSSLVIVPRHPERFDKVKLLLKSFAKKNNLTFTSYSQNTSLTQDIILIDSLGKLNNFYKIANLVILGGSFVKKGGHNPLEPAFFKTKIISGSYFYNQESLFKLVKNIKISNEDSLKSDIDDFLNNDIVSFVEKNNNLETLLNKIKYYD
jgi:3-deoxy-D-manno-octulosonic-acid transferase